MCSSSRRDFSPGGRFLVAVLPSGGNDCRIPAMTSDPLTLDLDQLPVPALMTRDGVFVAINESFAQLTGWTAEALIGRTLPELLAKLIAPRDRASLERLSKNRESSHPQRHGSLWCSVLSASGEERPMRVQWRLSDNGRDSVTVLVDAQPEAFGQEVTEALARAAGALSRCATENEVLQRAVDALCERGFTATVLLWDEADPLLRYGPSGAPGRMRSTSLDLPRVPRDLLERLNPSFRDHRAAYFQDGIRLVREAYAEPVAERLLGLLPAHRMVQAPIFLGHEPYGALVVTGDTLTPFVATALDLFAELVAKALESVRLRQELVQHERLAALGEAAAVMAHEVRNPVGSIMNALALLDRHEAGAKEGKVLLSIISEEATRLAGLVEQLLELGRPLHPRPNVVVMEEIVARAVHVLDKRGELARASLTMPQPRDTHVLLDSTLAELAIINIVKNALQSTGGTGNLRITVTSSDATVGCVVEDDGPGIPDDIRARIGQPFVTTRATGTGMGLAVVRRIMEASGGRLAIERADHGGTRGTLEFPRPPA